MNIKQTPERAFSSERTADFSPHSPMTLPLALYQLFFPHGKLYQQDYESVTDFPGRDHSTAYSA